MNYIEKSLNKCHVLNTFDESAGHFVLGDIVWTNTDINSTKLKIESETLDFECDEV